MSSDSTNTLYFGDNLRMLDRVPSSSVDLVYIDPPFNSAKQYNLLFKQVKGDPSPAQIMAFEDTWTWSPTLMEQFMETCDHPRLRRLLDGLFFDVLRESEMMAYIVSMAPRLLALHSKLKDTGSIYVHCDPVASHYLKIVMDVIFGPENFRNEVSWKRNFTKKGSQHKMRRYANNRDVLLFFSKSDKYHFETPLVNLPDSELEAKYNKIDASGRRFKSEPIELPAMMARPNLVFEYKGYTPQHGWMMSREKLEELDSLGKLYFTSGGKPRRKNFLDDYPGTEIDNNWNDIQPIGQHQCEKRGYPTQKPLALLERVLQASTRPGDVVLDAFCGCGTTVSAAQKLGRRWIGIDITYLAIREIEERMSEEFGMEKGVDYIVEGLPEDLDGAREFFNLTRKDSHKQFEMWAVSLVGGRPREKKGGDRGIDGDLLLQSSEGLVIAPLQVKGGSLNPSVIRDFAHVIEREKAPIGGMLTLERPTRGMEQEAQTIGSIESGGRRVNRLQLLPIERVLEKELNIQVPDGYSVPPSRYRLQGHLKI